MALQVGLLYQQLVALNYHQQAHQMEVHLQLQVVIQVALLVLQYLRVRQ